MEINIMEYVNEEEIREVILDTVRQQVYQQYARSESDLQRLLVNLSYRYIWDMIDRQYDGNLETLLRDKIKGLIENLSSYDVFRRESLWGDKKSVGQILLEEEVGASRESIKQRVEEIIKTYPFHELDQDEIGDVIYQCVMNRLFGEKR